MAIHKTPHRRRAPQHFEYHGMISLMTGGIASANQYPEHERYVQPGEAMQVLGSLLCNHPDVREGDRLQISFSLPDDRKVVVDTYWTFMTVGAEKRPGSLGSSSHRELLRQGGALIRASIQGGQKTYDYQIAKPSELSPGQAEMHFSAIFDRPDEEISSTVAALAYECDYAQSITAYDLCERLGMADIEPQLDIPHVFIEENGEYTILQSSPEQADYHNNLAQIVNTAKTMQSI